MSMFKRRVVSKLLFGPSWRNIVISREFSSSKYVVDLKWRRVPFNGVSADLGLLPLETAARDFSKILKESIEIWKKDNKRAMWLRVPVDKSYLIPAAFKHGFEYHHAEKDFSMLFRWLLEKMECKVPVYATHHIGASGLVLNEKTGEALVVQDKKKYKVGTVYKSVWKFPGGLSDEGEDIGDTAEREVFEETGVKSDFQSLLLFRQQHEMKGTFNKSDIYAICRMKPITYDIILCNNEIQDGGWMHLHDIIQHTDTSPITKLGAKLALNGLRYGFHHFDISAHKMRSFVDPSKTFLIYHRPLEFVDRLSEDNDVNSVV